MVYTVQFLGHLGAHKLRFITARLCEPLLSPGGMEGYQSKEERDDQPDGESNACSHIHPLVGNGVSRVMIEKVAQLLNKATKRWTWRDGKSNKETYLGKHYTIYSFLKGHTLNSNSSIKDVIESWLSEELVVECRAAMHIFNCVLFFYLYGETVAEAYRYVYHYSDAENTTNGFISLPIDASDLPSNRIINFTIMHTKSSFVGDYQYIPGSSIFLSRSFPLLDTSFQGENTIVVDPIREEYLGFFRDISVSHSKAEFLVKFRTEIETDLIKNIIIDFNQKYPLKTPGKMLTTLKADHRFSNLAIFNFKKYFKFENGLYSKIK